MAKPKSNWLPYEHAKRVINSFNITSRDQYYKWYDNEKHVYVPRRTYRIYLEEWNGWNEFLGTQNEFGNKVSLQQRTIIGFWDGVRWAQQLKLTSEKEWVAYCKENEIPDNIPRWPDRVYKGEWLGWDTWLGKTIDSKITTGKQVESTALLVFARDAKLPNNVLQVLINKEGKGAVMQYAKDNNIVLVRAYQFEPEIRDKAWSVIESLTGTYYDDKYMRVVTNMNDLWWELDQHLLRAN
jgi:hypothetical protein